MVKLIRNKHIAEKVLFVDGLWVSGNQYSGLRLEL